MLPPALQPVVWLLGGTLFYGSVGAGGVLLLTSLRTGSGSRIGGALVLLLGLAAAYIRLPLAAPIGLVAVGGGAVLCEILFYRFALRPALTWQTVKCGKETARQTSLHLVLLSGSL